MTSYSAVEDATDLTTTMISQASAKQRAGRTGRVGKGTVYRLYTALQFEQMQKYTKPEILRVRLSETCLKAKMLAGPNSSIKEFLLRALDKPAPENIENGITILKEIGALNESEDLTELRHQLVNMSIDCQLGKMIICSVLFQCVHSVLVIVSLISAGDPFLLTINSDHKSLVSPSRAVKAIKIRFSKGTYSDFVVYLNMFNEWQLQETQENKIEFCKVNKISNNTMVLVEKTYKALLNYLKKEGFLNPTQRFNSNDDLNNYALVQMCAGIAFYPNVGKMYRNEFTDQVFVITRGCNRGIAPSCILNNSRFDSCWVTHVENTAQGIRNATILPDVPDLFCILLGIPNKVATICDRENHDDGTEVDDGHDGTSNQSSIVLDENIKFPVDASEVSKYLQQRKIFANMFDRLVKSPFTFERDANERDVISDIVQRLRSTATPITSSSSQNDLKECSICAFTIFGDNELQRHMRVAHSNSRGGLRHKLMMVEQRELDTSQSCQNASTEFLVELLIASLYESYFKILRRFINEAIPERFLAKVFP